jgi:phage shock protein A
MNIFNKLSTLLRSNINDMIARAENPEKMLNQIILDMREQLTRAKQEVAVAIADERKLKAQVEEEHRQSTEWEKRAMVAVRENRDDLARQALVRQQEYAGRAQSLHESWKRQASETEKLKESLRQLNAKIEEARRKKNLLVAKEKRAQAQRRIHETMAGLSDRSAFEAFDRMADRIEDNERRALAAGEVADDLSADPLEKEFARLQSGAEAEDLLLGLKEKMGVLSPTERRQLSPGQKAAQEAGDVREAELLEEFEALEDKERQG